ncbi:MAG TPA: hypothetical protein VFJ11_03760 [Gaiellaceae bacterium]|nr:hypothetical protein [Gaiellaceae bacterium]
MHAVPAGLLRRPAPVTHPSVTAYPLPAEELAIDEESGGTRRFLSGPHRGAQQLQRKLVWFYSGWLEDDLDLFDPPMD